MKYCALSPYMAEGHNQLQVSIMWGISNRGHHGKGRTKGIMGNGLLVCVILGRSDLLFGILK